MVDIFKITKPLSSLSATNRVKPVGHRLNNNRQNQFKENFEKRQRNKKLKKDLKHAIISGGVGAADGVQHTGDAVPNKRSNEYSHRRIIDLRV